MQLRDEGGVARLEVHDQFARFRLLRGKIFARDRVLSPEEQQGRERQDQQTDKNHRDRAPQIVELGGEIGGWSGSRIHAHQCPSPPRGVAELDWAVAPLRDLNRSSSGKMAGCVRLYSTDSVINPLAPTLRRSSSTNWLCTR